MAKKKTASRAKKKLSDAIAVINRRYYEGRPRNLAGLEKARADDDVARKIYELRTEAQLSQRELAKLVATTASVICRLEDADYEGHSLPTLRRIAKALNKRVEIRFLPLTGKAQPV
jgi:ribosome-binding protein aMBF1 (putative translation factor)